MVTAAILLGLGSSALVGSPAFADTSTDTTPPASTEAPVDTTAPVVETSSDPAPVDTPSVAEPSPTPTEAPSPAPSGDPAITAAPTTAPASSQLKLTVAAAAIGFPPLALGHPASGDPGYTYCWASEINRTDVNLISPFDMRTWPVYVTPSDGQPGYIPHTVATTEGSDIWTQVTRDDPRYLNGTEGGVTFDGYAPDCHPVGNRTTYIATAEALDTSDHVISTVSGNSDGRNIQYTPTTGFQTIPADVAGAVKMRTTFSVQFPKIETVIDLAGNPTTDYYVGYNQFRFSAPRVNQTAFGFETPVGVSVSCDTPDTTFGFGDSATVTCVTIGQMPDVTFDEFRQAILDQFGTGVLVPFTTELGIDGRYVNVANPLLTGDWSSSSMMHPGLSQYEVKPAPAWLPTALNKSFRVKVAETLTVTPDGLLTGAAWTQGDVQTLDTYITNVPLGGAVTPDGNLEFTSDQIGDFGFNYFVQDPATGLRSQEATGNIQVYDEAAVSPLAPIVVSVNPEPPTSETPPAAVSLAYTGTDPGQSVLFALAFLIAGLCATIAASRRRRRSNC